MKTSASIRTGSFLMLSLLATSFSAVTAHGQGVAGGSGAVAPHSDSNAVLENRNSPPSDSERVDGDRSSMDPKRISEADTRFAAEASKAGATEIAASKLAISTTQNPKVRRYAQRMIDDHTKLAKELGSTLKSQGADASEPPPDDAIMSTLKSLSGSDFDQAYIEHVAVGAHRKAVDVFSNEAKNGDNPAIKSTAKSALPTLKHHLEMGQELSRTASQK